jgi:hypothetical protein
MFDSSSYREEISIMNVQRRIEGGRTYRFVFAETLEEQHPQLWARSLSHSLHNHLAPLQRAVGRI